MRYKLRSGLRKRVSKYPMSQRKAIRSQLSKPSLNVGGKYSGLMRFASSKKVTRLNNDKRVWYKKYRPGKKFKGKVKNMSKSKTLRMMVLAGATVGTILAVLPKDLLNKVADKVQEMGENVFNFAENLGDTAGSLVRALGTGADVFANGLGFVSENLGTITVVGVGGWVLNKML